MVRPDLEKELEERWKERQALEETKDETDDPFIPAKLAEEDTRPPLIHIEL